MQLPHIDGGKAFDWGRASQDYAQYRDIYPPQFYQTILDLGLCQNGQDILDLGTGTGVLPRGLYKHGGHWTGVDCAENQIQHAIRLSQDRGMDIRFFVAPAEATGLPDQSFDVITACQCIPYFDKPKLVRETVRLLRPGGHFLILYMVWLPAESEIARQSEALVLQVNPDWSGGNMHRTPCTMPDWATSAFSCVHALGYDVDIPFTRESWHGRIIACRGIGASSLPQSAIDTFTQAHLAYLQTVPSTFTIPHYVTLLDLQVNA